MKKAKISPMEAVLPPRPYPAVSEEDKARFKLHNLKQEYADLLKDAEVKRRKLAATSQKALRLKAEVRFLRKRYKFLTRNAQPTQNNVKTHPKTVANTHEHGEKISKTSPVLDLNQISFPEAESEFHTQSEAAESSFRKYPPEGDSRPPVTDVCIAGGLLKSPICRDAGSSSNQRGKRKVSWQDQLALKV